jgi:glucose-6-phosphate isomerase
VTAPVDATTTGAWTALTAHRDALTPDLRGWFDADADRATRLTHNVPRIYLGHGPHALRLQLL